MKSIIYHSMEWVLWSVMSSVLDKAVLGWNYKKKFFYLSLVNVVSDRYFLNNKLSAKVILLLCLISFQFFLQFTLFNSFANSCWWSSWALLFISFDEIASVPNLFVKSYCWLLGIFNLLVISSTKYPFI